jgi:hypothetical protein
MKKLLFVLFLIPFLANAQNQSSQHRKINADLIIEPLVVDTATVYTETGNLYFNKAVGNSIIAGGTFLMLGTVSSIVASFAKFDKGTLTPDPQAAANKRTAWSAVGYSFYGLSAICFITSGFQYNAQLNKRKNLEIRTSPTSVTMSYNF